MSAFLWVVAPEFITLVLGPAWGGVVLPFRLFSISLLFRMSSKISDACTKAAGEVYVRALLQYAYAAMVVVGAIIGQHWGVGGVAVGVSVAMCLNWLSMAWLGRSVTGLSWARFFQAHVPAAMVTIVVGPAAAVIAQQARGLEVGAVPVLMVSGLVAAGAALVATRLGPGLFLGPHGLWAVNNGLRLLRRGPRRRAKAASGRGEELAPAAEANSK